LSAGYVPTNNRNGCAYWTAGDWAEVHDAMRADWAIYGSAIMAWWRGENERFTDRFNTREKYRERGINSPWAFSKWSHDDGGPSKATNLRTDTGAQSKKHNS